MVWEFLYFLKKRHWQRDKMAEKNFEIKNVALKMGELGKDTVNFLLMLFVVFILLLVCWTKHEFGDVSLPQLLFFLMYDGSSGVDLRVVLEAVGVVVCLPIIITCGVFYFCKKKYNGINTIGKNNK